MGKLESPNQTGNKGNTGPSSEGQPGGKLVSPNKSTAAKEANGHLGNGPDTVKNRAFMS